MKDVLQAIEDCFVVLDFSILGGVCPPLAALKVGVHFTCVGRVLLVMCYLGRTDNIQCTR